MLGDHARTRQSRRPATVIQRFAMKFSLGYPLAHHPIDNAFAPPQVGGARRSFALAEECGYHSVNVTEHPMPGDKWLGAGGRRPLDDPFIPRVGGRNGAHRPVDEHHGRAVSQPVSRESRCVPRPGCGGSDRSASNGYLKPEYAMGVADPRAQHLVRRIDRGMTFGVDRGRVGSEATLAGATAHPAVQTGVPMIWVGGN